VDDATKEALRQLQELQAKIAAVSFERTEAEVLVTHVQSTVALIFGREHPYFKNIARLKFYYARAYPENRAKYFADDRRAAAAAIDRMENELRLHGLAPKESAPKSDQAPPKTTVILVDPIWKGRFEVEADLVFLAMPFSEPWSNDVWDSIKQIVTDAGMRCLRGDELGGRDVMEDVWEGICRARVVIADLTAKNPNVAYEVGLADAIGKDVILLTQTEKEVPFDFLRSRLIPSQDSISGSNKLKKDLLARLKKYTT